MSYDFDLIGKQILFTDNLLRNKRAVSLEKVYELMNAHIAVGASDTFIEEYNDVKDDIWELLIRIDKGEYVSNVEFLIERFITMLLSIIHKEQLDDLLKLALKVEAENYNPYRDVYGRIINDKR